jgi:hypothetical protein
MVVFGGFLDSFKMRAIYQKDWGGGELETFNPASYTLEKGERLETEVINV